MAFLPRSVVQIFKSPLKVILAVAIIGIIVHRVRFASIPVDSYVATMGSIVSEATGTGTLEARVQVTISAKISGRIVQVLADQGDRVTQNQLLVTLDDNDLRAQVEIAKTDLSTAKAGVDLSVADIAVAQATVVQARASSIRSEQLASRKGAISDQDLDKATQQRDVAEAQLRRAQLAKVEIERQVIKAEETLRYYQERLADTRIVSPFDGLIVRRSLEPGDIVVPGSNILQIISTEQMWISAWVDETVMPAIAPGQSARVIFRSEADKSYSGTVTRMSPLADRETREFLVDVTVKDLPKTWAVGQRAEVYIQTGKKDQALVVPQRTIIWQKGRPGLFVKDGGRARWRNVKLGLRGVENVEITEGLVAGDVAIMLHDPKGKPLTEGQAVSLVRAP